MRLSTRPDLRAVPEGDIRNMLAPPEPGALQSHVLEAFRPASSVSAATFSTCRPRSKQHRFAEGKDRAALS